MSFFFLVYTLSPCIFSLTPVTSRNPLPSPSSPIYICMIIPRPLSTNIIFWELVSLLSVWRSFDMAPRSCFSGRLVHTSVWAGWTEGVADVYPT